MNLPTRYNFSASEEALYNMWENGGFFQPEIVKDANGTSYMSKPIEDRPAPFTVMMPPPNATGILHLGHAARMTTEDIMVRYHRMKGDPSLYLPGTDHAGIATQSKVEEVLMKEEGKNRHDLGREKFLERVEEYVEQSQDTIRNQIRRTGASCDWSRESYTFSPELNTAVNEIFKQMYEDGLIYRGGRSINWDPKLHTTVADDEMEYKEEKAEFYTFQYGPFEIGTARPETKFGDKYVVIHPEDERYKQYNHGDTFECEWINGPITATIIKDEAADPEFGTGVMTITPWHSKEDFEIAQRHNLDMEQIIDLDGNLLPVAQEFAGMPISKARPKIVEKLKEKGLLLNIDKHYIHNISINYRGGGIIEPQVMKQWFVDVNKKAVHVAWNPGEKLTIKEALQSAVKKKADGGGGITILPNRFNKTYSHWIENLRDWCISRQLWWGHRIPMWYPIDAYGEEASARFSLDGTDLPKGEWKQDEDTLDTWFSSMLWAFSPLGWPERTDDLKYFHPTSVLETGYDILPFWVARMILASTYAKGEIPFKTVYLSGLIRDRSGAKMSKSKGNGIDPIEMIEKYGADAVRLSLIVGTTPGNDSRLYEEKIKGYRNFSTKLWNVARFILTTFPDAQHSDTAPEPKTLADKWILSRLAATQQQVTESLETFQLGNGGDLLYTFTWHELADWYVELLKSDAQKDSGKVARFALEQTLRMLHPYTPFITEEIWGYLEMPQKLIITEWPEALQRDEMAEVAFEEIIKTVEEIRGIRGAFTIKNHIVLDATLESTLNKEQRMHIETLAGVKYKETLSGTTLHLEHSTLNVENHIDVETERERLTKEQENLEQFIARLEKKLGNQKFIENAPETVVEEERTKLTDAQTKLQSTKTQLHTISS